MVSDGDTRNLNEFIDMIRAEFEVDEDLTPDSALLSSGLIDSFDVVVLLDLIESRYGTTIPVEAVDGETFNTPRQILARIDAWGPSSGPIA